MVIRQAIVVKYLGPTNSRGSRYKATCDAGSITMDADQRYNAEENAINTALRLAHKLGWDKFSDFLGGALPGSGYVFVAVDKRGLSEDGKAFVDYVAGIEEDLTDDDPRIRGRREITRLIG
jgi:hypothetical protein